MKMFFKPLVVASFLLASTFTYADVEALTKKLESFNSLEGSFTQEIFDGQKNSLQESSGSFLLQKPGRFRWETIEPFPQLLVTNLTTLWLYDPDLEQVTIQDYDPNVANTPALLLSGNSDEIEKHYQVAKKSDDEFLLMPLSDQALFETLTVRFEKNYPVEMQLLDSLGQTTIFSFTNIQNDPSISVDSFDFSPPEGTDIIYQ